MTKKKAGARLLKRIILGKTPPPKFIKSLTIFTIIWSSILGLLFGLLGIYAWIDKEYLQETIQFNDFTPKFCFSYALLHALSIIGAVLIYRLKRNGFYLYTIANICMVILPFFMLNNYEITLIHAGFTVIMILLYLTQLKKLE